MAHILLVDDDDDLRDALQTFLEDAGHGVVTARDGAGALEELSRIEPPDIVVTDFYMPVMDGAELTARMRADPRLASIPIVIMSAATTIPHVPGTTLLPKMGLRQSLPRLIGRFARIPETV